MQKHRGRLACLSSDVGTMYCDIVHAFLLPQICSMPLGCPGITLVSRYPDTCCEHSPDSWVFLLSGGCRYLRAALACGYTRSSPSSLCHSTLSSVLLSSSSHALFISPSFLCCCFPSVLLLRPDSVVPSIHPTRKASKHLPFLEPPFQSAELQSRRPARGRNNLQGRDVWSLKTDAQVLYYRGRIRVNASTCDKGITCKVLSTSFRTGIELTFKPRRTVVWRCDGRGTRSLSIRSTAFFVCLAAWKKAVLLCELLRSLARRASILMHT